MNHADLQRRLTTLGRDTGKPGWGPLLRAAVYDELTSGPDHAITQFDIDQAAAMLGGTAAQVWAVYRAESSGDAFIDGRPSILFEPHRFSRSTDHRYDKSHPHISSRAWNKALYPRSQAGRWKQLLDAVALDVDAGFMSASYGGFQILGENFAVCGAHDPWSFAWRQAQTEGDQVEAFVRFVEGRGLKAAFRQISSDPNTCRAFSRGFNGTGYALNHHHVHIADAHRRAS